MDISVILEDWPYDPDEGANNVRLVAGVDEKLKVQIRLKDGLLQWEAEDRPDGARPYGFATVLGYCEHLLKRHRRNCRGASDSGFSLSKRLARELIEEIEHYSSRRKVFFKLQSYHRALEDAIHDLRALEFIQNYYFGERFKDRHRLLWPEVVVDKARAAALFYIQQQASGEAIEAINTGLVQLQDFYNRMLCPDPSPIHRQKQHLVDLRRSLREKYGVPLTKGELLEMLRTEQEAAIGREDYETAARIRDKIKNVSEKNQGGRG